MRACLHLVAFYVASWLLSLPCVHGKEEESEASVYPPGYSANRTCAVIHLCFPVPAPRVDRNSLRPFAERTARLICSTILIP